MSGMDMHTPCAEGYTQAQVNTYIELEDYYKGCIEVMHLCSEVLIVKCINAEGYPVYYFIYHDGSKES